MSTPGFELRSVNANSGGIRKAPVLRAVVLGMAGLEGDHQSNQKHHGGPDQTVCLYAEEDYAALRELGVTADVLPAGSFGENFTTRGVDWRDVAIGQRFRGASGVEIEISSFRVPCNNLTVLSADLPKVLYREYRFGAYARTITAGSVHAGEHFDAVSAPESPVELLVAQRALFEPDASPAGAGVLARVLAQPALSARTRVVFERRAASSRKS